MDVSRRNLQLPLLPLNREHKVTDQVNESHVITISIFFPTLT